MDSTLVIVAFGFGLVFVLLLARIFVLRKRVVTLSGELEAKSDDEQKARAEQDTAVKMLIKRDIDLREINERLEAMGQEKNQFISVAAHELRTPLTTIKWTVDLFASGKVGKLTEKQSTHIAQVVETVDSMIALVGDILHVAEIEEGRFGMRMSHVALSEVLDEVFKQSSEIAEERTVRIELDAPDNLPALHADKDKLTLALKNLVDNAVKYSHPGGVVRVRAKEYHGMLTIEVADEGIGIPSDSQGQVFKKFYRSANALQHETRGTGLGLFISRNIILAHKGTVSLASEEGAGTTFTVMLPVRDV